MAVSTPEFASGSLGRLLVNGLSGDCVSLMRWRLFIPENKKQVGNYCVNPMTIVNTPDVYVQVAGGWDTANPPHKSPYFFQYGTQVVLWLGVKGTTHGYLGQFIVSSEEIGHSLAEGADFQFQAHLQGLLVRYPA